MDDGTDHEPPADDPEPAPRTDERVRESATVRTTPTSSSWEINWVGAGTVALVAVVVGLAWSWLGGDDDTLSSGSDAAEVSVATTAPPTTTRRTTTTTTSPPTTVSTTTTTTVPERRVVITGEVKPCRFGASCLAASFVIEGFDEHPGRFACIYPNSVSDFEFNDDDVIDACLTGDVGDTITIEVAGIRSATISEDDLDGTG